MEKYIVTGDFLGISEGQIIKLSDDQLRKRKSLVKPLKKGKVQAIMDFHLKRGEVFETDLEINKKLAEIVQTKKEYDEKPVQDKIEDLTKKQLLDFAIKNCNGMEISNKKTNGEIKDIIISFFENKKEG